MAKRSSQEINAGSMADIAFLLLIFFLVATTMNVDSGIMRTLPPMADESEKQENLKVNQRNLMYVSINQDDILLLNLKEQVSLDRIAPEATKFILNLNNDESLPEFVEEDIELIGKVKVSKGVISLENHRSTSYEMYVMVQNELTRAFNEIREDAAHRYFGMPFEQLDEPRKDAIRKVVPMRISEAEPRGVK